MIYLVQADGSGITFLTEGSGPSWSADGSRLLYSIAEDDQADADRSFAVFDLDTGTSTILVNMGTVVDDPVWSPDESMIAYVEREYDPDRGWYRSPTLHIWDGEKATTVAEDTYRWIDDRYWWSPDGTSLRFSYCEYIVSGTPGTMCHDELPGFENTTMVYNADGSFAAVLRDLDGEVALCIDAIPRDGACTPFPKGSPQLIDWRPN